MTRNVRLGDVVIVGFMFWVVLLGWLGWESAVAQQKPVETVDASGESMQGPHGGKEVYNLFCIGCHAPRGQGSPLAKTLLDTQAITMNDTALIKVITEGRPDKGMMAFGGALSEEEIINVAEYVRELQGRAPAAATTATPTTAPADDALSADLVNEGEALFSGKAGCIQCHSYYNLGGWVGPELDKLALRLTPEQIHQSVAEPSAVIVDGYAAKSATTPEGDTITARFRKETDDTVQLLLDNGDLWRTYYKDDLQSLEEIDHSIMPAEPFANLEDTEQEALLAFLNSLK